MLAYIHQDERVMPVADNRQLFAMLQSSNNNANQQSGKMNVEIHNNGSNHVSVERTDDNRLRVMIEERVPGLIASHAPGVIANDIANPNGKTAKAITRNTNATRQR
jgi:hypothetical protein